MVQVIRQLPLRIRYHHLRLRLRLLILLYSRSYSSFAHYKLRSLQSFSPDRSYRHAPQSFCC